MRQSTIGAITKCQCPACSTAIPMASRPRDSLYEGQTWQLSCPHCARQLRADVLLRGQGRYQVRLSLVRVPTTQHWVLDPKEIRQRKADIRRRATGQLELL